MLDTVSSPGTSLKSQMLQNLGGNDMAGVAKAAAALLNDGSCVRLTTAHTRTYVTVTPPASAVPELDEPTGSAGGPASRNADLEKLLLFLQLDNDQLMTKLAQDRLEHQKGAMKHRHDEMSVSIRDNIAKIERAMKIQKALSIFGWIVSGVMLIATVASGGAAWGAKGAVEAAQMAAQNAVEAAVENVVKDIATKAVEEAVTKAAEEAVAKAAEDVATEAVEKAVTEAVTEAVEEAVAEAAKKAASTFADKAVQEVVTDTVKEVLDEAVKTAAQKAASEVVSKAAGKAAEDAMKKGIEKTVEEAVKKVVKESVQRTVEAQVNAAYQHLKVRFAQAVSATVLQAAFTALDFFGGTEKLTKAVGERMHKSCHIRSSTGEAVASGVLSVVEMLFMAGVTIGIGYGSSAIIEKGISKKLGKQLGDRFSTSVADRFAQVGKGMLNNVVTGVKTYDPRKLLLRAMTSSSASFEKVLFMASGAGMVVNSGLTVWSSFANRDAQYAGVKTKELSAGLKLVEQMLQETTEELEQLIQKVEACLSRMASVISSAYETEVEIAHHMGQMA